MRLKHSLLCTVTYTTDETNTFRLQVKKKNKYVPSRLVNRNSFIWTILILSQNSKIKTNCTLFWIPLFYIKISPASFRCFHGSKYLRRLDAKMRVRIPLERIFWNVSPLLWLTLEQHTDENLIWICSQYILSATKICITYLAKHTIVPICVSYVLTEQF